MCFVVTSTWKDRTWPSPPQICIFYDVLHLYVHLGTFLSVTLCTYCYIRVLFIVHLSITTQSVRQKKSSRGIQGKSQHHAQQRNESKQRTTILLVPPSPPPPHHPTAVVSIFIFIQVCFFCSKIIIFYYVFCCDVHVEGPDLAVASPDLHIL